MIEKLLNEVRVAVVGDAIIDEYYLVKAEKISPEFPIPIMQSEFLEPNISLPGGACNVCYQFKNFNTDLKYFGILDEEAREILLNYKINLDGCAITSDSKSRVPRKKRFYQDNFPLCRLDVESKNYNVKDLKSLQNFICNNLSKTNFDVAIFSDYSKGLFDDFDIQNYYNSLDDSTIKIVDPKNGPISKWKGCSIIKPNSKEAKILSGKEYWKEQALYFRQETDARVIVITQGGKGVVGIAEDSFFEYYPDNAISPNSVIGAGDCFLSILSLGVSLGFSISKSIELAFLAGSKYVTNKYNKPINPCDLVSSKFVDPIILRNRDFTLCFTNGCFDILHLGHIETLRYAKSKAEKLVVAINSNLSVSLQNKSHSMVNDIEVRKKMIESLDFVDFVVVFDQETPKDIIKTIMPDVLVKSEQYSNPVGAEFVKETFLFPVLDGHSTTKIIEKIKNLN